MSHWVRVQKVLNTGRKDQASMVCGMNVKVRRAVRMVKNPEPLFEAACELAGVKMTIRQRNKFNRGVGAAFAKRNDARLAISSTLEEATAALNAEV